MGKLGGGKICSVDCDGDGSTWLCGCKVHGRSAMATT